MADNGVKVPRLSLLWGGSCSFRGLRRHTSGSAWEMAFSSMNGWQARYINFQSGDRVCFQYGCQVEGGSLSAELIAPDGRTVLTWRDNAAETTNLTPAVQGKHTVRVTADHASGGFQLHLLPIDDQPIDRV